MGGRFDQPPAANHLNLLKGSGMAVQPPPILLKAGRKSGFDEQNCSYFPFTGRRNASRRSMSSNSPRAPSGRRSSDLRRSMPLRRSNPLRRSRPACRSAPSQVVLFRRRSRPERDPPLSWISRSAECEASVSRMSVRAVIRFSNSLRAGLSAFSAPDYLNWNEQALCQAGDGKAGLDSGRKQRPPIGLGQAGYRDGKRSPIV